MSSPVPQFENKDLSGSTGQFVSTVGVAPISLPAVAANVVAYALVRCGTDNTPNTKRLLYSLDNGVTFGTLGPGEFIGWPLRGGITQIQIKGNIAAVSYEVMLNFEPSGEGT